ncbi:hypothetical protein PCH_Pc24g01360 [Penicillium rubens Wisconsin 54-1255]|uniref:Uncharacterized protein n=1 Tax=Penicillium rubens (strain ATCC 28089 / DSM 1075 / NRRL 1951 / Wisconsin 54-1255) TaxID=500485 RepID=B6HWS7_PENRW|nr:hypothetical protein PCH_Pc24g01360 [Penicillium rubens Wisconsin 54-1255]
MSWNPFAVCGIPHGGPVKKIGHQKLTTLAREPFDLSTLLSRLCDIAKGFLCARWHRQRQAEQVGQQWYEAAVRNQARVPENSRAAAPSIAHPGQRQISSAPRRHPTESPDTDRSSHGLREDGPMLPTNPELVQPLNLYVNSTMLRTNSVPWSVSPARPAIPLAGFQNLTLQSLTPSEEVDSITFEKRHTGYGTSCCVCRNEGALDALVRPFPTPLSDAETHSVHTAGKPSPTGGPRRSTRLSGRHLPPDPSTSAPLRRSARRGLH